MTAFLRALNKAKKRDNGKPQMIIAQTLIGKGIPEVAGTAKAHGEAGAKFVDEARKNLGLPAEHYLCLARDARIFREAQEERSFAQYKRWEKSYQGLARRRIRSRRSCSTTRSRKKCRPICSSKIPAFPADAKIATRKAGSEVLQPLAQAMPLLISGSADLHGSTLNYIEGGEDFTRDNHKGRNIHFGIREHGMCAIMNGVAYHGIFRASGRDLPRLRRLLPRRPSVSRRSRSCRTSTSSRTTPSAWARTARRTSRWRR